MTKLKKVLYTARVDFWNTFGPLEWAETRLTVARLWTLDPVLRARPSP
jgi:hypothetical protein